MTKGAFTNYVIFQRGEGGSGAGDASPVVGGGAEGADFFLVLS